MRTPRKRGFMEYLFAPMEGITFSFYRSLHHQMFPGAAEYYTPFIAPDANGTFKAKYLRDLTDDHGEGFVVIPQLLANRAEAFNITADKLHALGFDTVNLNTGCPSGTVFSKHKGAGMLTDLPSLDAFLDGIFSHAEQQGFRISVKTRMGVQTTGEFPAILELFNRYPVTRLIVHARAREGYYKSIPDLAAYAAAAAQSRAPVCCNGNLFSVEDLTRLQEASPETKSVMIGRGVVANPALIREMRGGQPLRREELQEFHDRLLEGWLERGLQPNFTVERMKTLWHYMQACFPDNRKEIKAVLKARAMPEYRSAVSILFRTGDFTASFSGNTQF